MIAVKNSELRNIATSLIPLCNTTKIPVKIAYVFGLLLKKVRGLLTYFNEMHDQILKDHADKDENGKPVMINGNQYRFEDGAKVTEAINALSNTDAYIEGKYFEEPPKIKLSVIPADLLTGKMVADLDGVIEFVDDEVPTPADKAPAPPRPG